MPKCFEFLPLCFVGVISFFSASANGMGLLSRRFFWLRRLAKALQQRTEKIDYRACACVCVCVACVCTFGPRSENGPEK